MYHSEYLDVNDNAMPTLFFEPEGTGPLRSWPA